MNIHAPRMMVYLKWMMSAIRLEWKNVWEAKCLVVAKTLIQKFWISSNQKSTRSGQIDELLLTHSFTDKLHECKQSEEKSKIYSEEGFVRFLGE